MRWMENGTMSGRGCWGENDSEIRRNLTELSGQIASNGSMDINVYKILLFSICIIIFNLSVSSKARLSIQANPYM